MKRLVSIFAIAALCIPAVCGAWTLEWDDNTETDLAGYRVYMSSTPPPDEVFVQVAQVNVSCFPLDELDEGNYFTVSAFDFAGNESAKAVPVKFVIPDNLAPTVPGNLHITENVCSADVTKDGTVNVLDYLTYWRDWYGQRGRTDCIQAMN